MVCMGFTYAIIGSGRQGTSSAFDFAVNGDADKIILADSDLQSVQKSINLLERLTGKSILSPAKTDAGNFDDVLKILKEADAAVSGVPYYYNLNISNAALEAGCSLFDFGGNTEVVENQLALDAEAEKKGITIVPDCGMDPGMNINLIMYLFSLYDEPVEIKSYGAGLPLNPVSPWNYSLNFHINGLTNEYYGDADFIRNGKHTKVPCLEELELIELPEPFGKLEAAVTTGGLSTLPQKLSGKIKTLENKTLRYPGHWKQFQAYKMLGLFEETPVKIGEREISPREFYHFLLAPHISSEDTRDAGIIKIFSRGVRNGKEESAEIEIIDKYDDTTGFTSMQKLTGWHASIIAIEAAKGRLKKGALSVDTAISGEKLIEQLKRRKINIKINKSF